MCKYVGGDLQKFSSKLPGFFWAKYKGEHHITLMQYCGPNSRLDIRLDENNKPKPGEEPINRVDDACLKHDILYNSENLEDRHIADVKLIHELNNISNPTLKEKLAKLLIKNIMKAKIFVGASVDTSDKVRATELHLDEIRATEFAQRIQKTQTFFKSSNI